MTSTKDIRFDRRGGTRRPKQLRGLVGHKGTPPQNCENALIEDVGGGGLRLRSGSQIRPDESLILYVGDEQKPLPVKVVWAKKEGVIEKRASGKPGQAFVAGCHLKSMDAPKPAEKKRGAAKVAKRKFRDGDTGALVIKCAFYAGGLGLLGLILYGALSVLQLMG